MNKNEKFNLTGIEGTYSTGMFTPVKSTRIKGYG
jgi:hypothetical protein